MSNQAAQRKEVVETPRPVFDRQAILSKVITLELTQKTRCMHSAVPNDCAYMKGKKRCYIGCLMRSEELCSAMSVIGNIKGIAWSTSQDKPSTILAGWFRRMGIPPDPDSPEVNWLFRIQQIHDTILEHGARLAALYQMEKEL